MKEAFHEIKHELLNYNDFMMFPREPMKFSYFSIVIL